MDIFSIVPILAPAALIVVAAVAITRSERAERVPDDDGFAEPPIVRLEDSAANHQTAPAPSEAGGLVRPVGAASLGARLQACPTLDRPGAPVEEPPARPRVVVNPRRRRRPLVARR